ncbi:MAG: tetratricopeptide repeat protein [Cytophagales bacterium]|nr:tetratricopeptide repeat protein [Armatimonadota bacterium]
MRHAETTGECRVAAADLLVLMSVLLTLSNPAPSLGATRQPLPLVISPGAQVSARQAISEGDRLLQAGDGKAAARRYAWAAQRMPSDPLYQMTAGVALASVGRTSEALAAFRRADALAGGGDALAALLVQGVLSENSDDSPDVQALYARTVQRFTRPGVRGLDTSASVARLVQARSQFPTSPILALLLGDSFQLAEQWSEADRAYRQAISLAPKWVKPWINLGLSQLVQGRSGEAIAAFQAALALDPGNSEAQIAKADAQLQSGMVEDAVASYRKVEGSKNNRIASQAATGIGQAYAVRGQVSDAVKALNRAQQLAPADPAPAAALGEVQLQARNYPAAAAAYDDALRLSRGRLFVSRAILYRALAETQLSAQNGEGAIETLQRALLDEPAGKPLWLRLWAQALYLRGDTNGGEAKLKQALASESGRYPQDTLNALDARGLIPSLIRDLEAQQTAATSDSARGELLRTLASLARFQRRAADEVTFREALTKLQPTGPNWFALGESYERRAGDEARAAARAAYQKALNTRGLTAAMASQANQRISALTPSTKARPALSPR